MYGLQSGGVLIVFSGEDTAEFSVSAFSLVVDVILPYPISRSLIFKVVFILERAHFQNVFGFDFRSWASLGSKHALSCQV